MSFCVDEVEVLSDDALAYLRRYGPVGCRDWTTVFLLLSAGVDAFFTGGITTTVDAIVPARRDDRSGASVVAWIDATRVAGNRSHVSAPIHAHRRFVSRAVDRRRPARG